MPGVLRNGEMSRKCRRHNAAIYHPCWGLSLDNALSHVQDAYLCRIVRFARTIAGAMSSASLTSSPIQWSSDTQ